MITRRLDSNWDMTFGHGLFDYARDQEAVSQNVKTRLQLLREEWFLDVDAGVPYLQEIMVKPANVPLTKALLKQTIIETEGIDELRSFEMLYDNTTRHVTVNATVTTIYGTTENIRTLI
jgi:hypothetical protein